MKNSNWEDKLREHLGKDADRFPLAEGHFDTLKERIMARKEEQIPKKGKTFKLRAFWWLALPAAAALAFFLLNRNAVPQDTTPEKITLDQAAEGLYEQMTGSENLIDLNAEEVKNMAGSPGFEIIQAEVLMEDILIEAVESEENNEDIFSGIEAAEIEEYLVDDLILIYEL